MGQLMVTPILPGTARRLGIRRPLPDIVLTLIAEEPRRLSRIIDEQVAADGRAWTKLATDVVRAWSFSSADVEASRPLRAVMLRDLGGTS